MNLHDSLGTRMKEQYENRARYMLPRRTYTVIRIDGKAFHSYTRGMPKPFSQMLHNAMAAAASLAEYPEWGIFGSIVTPSQERTIGGPNWKSSLAPGFTTDDGREFLRGRISGVEIEAV